MALDDYEATRTLGQPVDLYLFVHGPGAADYYAYTDYDGDDDLTVDIEVNGTTAPVTFTRKPVKRDTVKSSGTLDKAALTVELPRDAEAAELFRVYPPTQEVSLTIFQGHVGDADAEFLVIWAGRVLSCKYEHSAAKLNCEPVATSMKRAMLRLHYQYGCPHALYMGDSEGGCRASKAAATVATTASAVSGTQLMLPSGWNGAFAKAKFRQGLVEWTGSAGQTERRTILQVDESANVLGLSGIIRDLEDGGAVDVILGCDHLLDGDCKNLHDNVQDYGGEWLIPVKNPFGFYNNYY